MHAQDTTGKKPGGLNKVAHDVSKTAKKAGRDTKAEVHRDASAAHQGLRKAGNETKTVAGNATGIHKIGGSVGAAAQDVSHASKEAGAKIDPETAVIHWHWAQVIDPYGIFPYRPEADCVGREYFARSPESDIWVDFGDLPPKTRDALWRRIDSNDSWSFADDLPF